MKKEKRLQTKKTKKTKRADKFVIKAADAAFVLYSTDKYIFDLSEYDVESTTNPSQGISSPTISSTSGTASFLLYRATRDLSSTLQSS